jgi:DNA-directed RNA polymerase sigma subunit (sigma70/sigma32)
MAGGPDELVKTMRSYIEVITALMAGLEAYRAKQVQALDDLRAGMSLMESVQKRDSATLSRDLAGLVEDFEEVRRSIRGIVSRALRDEGATLQEIGHVFGVSAQLASRFLKESNGAIGEDPA